MECPSEISRLNQRRKAPAYQIQQGHRGHQHHTSLNFIQRQCHSIDDEWSWLLHVPLGPNEYFILRLSPLFLDSTSHFLKMVHRTFSIALGEERWMISLPLRVFLKVVFLLNSECVSCRIERTKTILKKGQTQQKARMRAKG